MPEKFVVISTDVVILEANGVPIVIRQYEVTDVLIALPVDREHNFREVGPTNWTFLLRAQDSHSGRALHANVMIAPANGEDFDVVPTDTALVVGALGEQPLPLIRCLLTKVHSSTAASSPSTSATLSTSSAIFLGTHVTRALRKLILLLGYNFKLLVRSLTLDFEHFRRKIANAILPFQLSDRYAIALCFKKFLERKRRGTSLHNVG